METMTHISEVMAPVLARVHAPVDRTGTNGTDDANRNGTNGHDGTHANGNDLAQPDHPEPIDADRSLRLPDLLDRFHEHEGDEYPDLVVPLASLRMEDDLLHVPAWGAFQFTDWSRRQCACLLGLRWDRWFENTSMTDRSDELNRRFHRASGSVKLRTTKESLVAGKDHPTLRAIVSPSYAPVMDSTVAELLLRALKPQDEELRIIRASTTDRTTSYVVKVGKSFRPGDDHEVGDVWGGLLVLNSGVGFASLMVSLHLTRLLCKNGMVAPIPNAVLLKRRHLGMDEAKLAAILAHRFDDLPGKLRAGAERLREARGRRVDDVSIEVRRILTAQRLPLRLLAPVLAAYDREPHPSVFGIAQAMTRAAQEVTAEERVEIEGVAGGYLATLAAA